jgi:hypothetical protein
MKEGNGKLIFPNGDFIEGRFIKDEFQGGKARMT